MKSFFKLILCFITSLSFIACNKTEILIENKDILQHKWLLGMYGDQFYPKILVDEAKALLLQLCHDIELNKPNSTSQILTLTHATTNKFNDLANKFDNAGSEFETNAREVVAEDFVFILETYGFNVDIEEAIATRDW